MNCLIEGNILQERYRIEEVLGKGAMGTIYLAWDSRLSQKRAIKEMNPSFLEEEDKEGFTQLFKQEAHILSRLHHANLPKVIDYFCEDGRYYLVMDYIDGENLKDYRDRNVLSMGIKEISQITCQICDVLEYLHCQKPDPIIFRDLKPSNIMIMPDLTVKLIDFGIARIFKDSKDCDTIIVGTPGFAPPEQYGKRQTDERSDIYSLGATFYYMFTGDVPDLPDQKGRAEIEKNPRLPDKVKPLILKALSPESKNRYRNVSEFRKALKELLDPPTQQPVKEELPVKSKKDREIIKDHEDKSVNVFYGTTLTFLFMLIPSCIFALMGYFGRMYYLPHLREDILLQILCLTGFGLFTGSLIWVISKLRKISGYNWQVLIGASIIPVILNSRNIFTLLIPEWGQQTFTIILTVILCILMYIASMVIVTLFRYKKPEFVDISVEEKKSLSSYIGQCGTVNATLKPMGNIIIDGEEKLFSACTNGSQYIEEGRRVKITGVKMGDFVVEAL